MPIPARLSSNVLARNNNLSHSDYSRPEPIAAYSMPNTVLINKTSIINAIIASHPPPVEFAALRSPRVMLYA